ncbi:hypothetical protein, partial [Salmonella sp. s51944]|uniref:hypothetical protein n=1 Tax=Salmonella sp. s51944 TaxID=3159655 RepID=UPI00398176F2
SPIYDTKYCILELHQYPTHDKFAGMFCPKKINARQTHLRCIKFETVIKESDYYLSIADDYDNTLIIQTGDSSDDNEYLKKIKEDFEIDQLYHDIKNCSITEALHHMKLSRARSVGLVVI